MEKNPNIPNRVKRDDEVYSSWFELEQSTQYTNEDAFSTELLLTKGSYWMRELDNPSRSERGKKEIMTILDRITVVLELRLNADISQFEALPSEDAA